MSDSVKLWINGSLTSMKQSDFLPACFNKKLFAIFSFSYALDLISLRHVMALISYNVWREWQKECLNLKAWDYSTSRKMNNVAAHMLFMSDKRWWKKKTWLRRKAFEMSSATRKGAKIFSKEKSLSRLK